MWCGREKSYIFLVELVVDFLLQFYFDACYMKNMVIIKRNIGFKFNINTYILLFFLNKYGVKLCKSVRGLGGSKVFRLFLAAF